MRSITLTLRWIGTVSCAAVLSTHAVAEEGFVQMTDGGANAGVVHIGDRAKPAPVQPAKATKPQTKKRVNYAAVYMTAGRTQGACVPVNYAAPMSFPQGAYSPMTFQQGGCGPAGCPTGGPVAGIPSECCGPMGFCGPNVCYGPVISCDPLCCPVECCPTECCPSDSCDSCAPDSCGEGCCSNDCCCGSSCSGANCGCGCNNGCYYGPGHNERMLTVFAKANAKSRQGGSKYPKRWWRGQQSNYLTRNQRLSDIMFGWLVPSGYCGQGTPPFGKYQITYADQPCDGHPQDAMAYGAQGYGVPVTVPLPPNVRHAYNYSWGLPASRLTPIGHCSPGTTPEPLYRRTW